MSKIELWINEEVADLDNEAIILFNYAMEDLTNPAIVKNSYTQTVSLQGTATNNRIFSHIYRADRLTRSGFNPQERTPFRIVKDGELLESGYLKLDKVDKNGAKLTYNVTLYGGLGSFFYALSYRADGEKKTLADLDYVGDGTRLSYDIYASVVSNAWDNLGKNFDRSNIWHTLNFAPCYNGIPSDDFSADKAIFQTENYFAEQYAPYPQNKTQDGKVYHPTNFVQLSQSYDEWQTRDLRAYLQRPIVRVQSIFEALKSEATKNGFTLNLDSSFFYDRNPYYGDAWITRPLLNTLELKASSGYVDITIPDAPQITPTSPSATVRLKTDIKTEGSVSIGGSVCARIHIALKNTSGLAVGDTLYLRDYVGEYPAFSYSLNVRAFNGSVIKSGEGMPYPSQFIFTWNGKEAVSNSYLDFYFSDTTNVGWLEIEGSLGGDFTLRSTSDNSKTYPIDYVYLTKDDATEVHYSGGTSARTGSTITQDDLLTTSGTPADYLLSYCKMFGLHFTYDKFTNTVSIVTRDTLYAGAKTIDIESRIDRSKAITTTPYAFDAKLYDFGVENTEGAFTEYYKRAYGRDYGLHRVNTGYAFDASNKDVMESVIFKGAAMVLARGRYFNRVRQNNKNVPSIFLDAGHKVTYVNPENSGDSFDYDIPTINRDATIDYINSTYKSYDSYPRLQFCDEENAPIDGEDVLVIYSGNKAYDIMISDDDSAMFATYNDGVPCWILHASRTQYPLPNFSRYTMSGKKVNVSFDFGIPAEIDIPGITHPSGTTVYDRGWAKYLADRYNVDTKVVKCNVDWRGIQVGEYLLRNFYYFDGAIWVLNKITNHDITGYGTTQCEFVKVQSKTNYLYGQNYDI